MREQLRRAFIELRKRGIYAARHVLCCLGCSTEEIARRLKAWTGKPIRGAVWMHAQDEERLREGRPTNLAFAVWPPCDEDWRATALGWEIVAELRKWGIETEWSGDPKERIEIKEKNWKD